ncbi:MAG: 50S ribosomal protein L32 [Gammaproteobacteria bacterium]|nr:50S ribosomal protein L32 [Gammaproteobacteria bacterium]
MALPKFKSSKSRRDKRRGANQLEAGSVSTCSQCGEAKLPHRVCGKCGFYGNKKILEVGGAE